MNDDEKLLLDGMIKSVESKGLDSSILKDDLYNFDQKFVLRRAIITDSSLENIANPDIPADEMESILNEQQEMVANLEANHNLDPATYNLKQLQELDKALNKGLDISHYKDPAFSSEQMYLATTFQEGGIEGLTDIKPTWSTDDILALRSENLNIAHQQENRVIPTLDKMDTEDGVTLQELQTLIINGADVNKAIVNHDLGISHSPLLLAVFDDKPTQALTLIVNGADINDMSGNEQTILGNARSPCMVSYLLRHGADIEQVDGYGDTALIQIISNPRTEHKLDMVNQLLENGASPNVQNWLGQTPLHLLENTTEHIEIAKSLIEHGADYQLSDSNDNLPKVLDSPEMETFLESQKDLPPWENSNFGLKENAAHDFVMTDSKAGKHIFLSSNDEVMKLLEKHDPDGLINELRTTGKLELSNGETLDLSIASPVELSESLAEELDIPHITVEPKESAKVLQQDGGVEIE